MTKQDAIKNSDLFSWKKSLVAPLFEETVYPWEILPLIGNFVKKLTEENPMGFTEYASGIFVGKNVRISKTATLIPPAILCDNTELRPGAFLRGNVFVGENCTVGNSTELKNCILLDHAEVPHYNYVGDAILGVHAHMGAGAVCSNLKSDKKNIVIHGETNYETGLRKIGAFLGDHADIGCGSVLNPGTIIGRNTRIYPLTAVRGVIKEDRIVKSMQDIVILKGEE